MILAQASGNNRGAYVLIDATFPHWSVHYGRRSLRKLAEAATKAHREGRSWGWVRDAFYPQQTAVSEFGDAKLQVWPCDGSGLPREWTPRDDLWRDVMSGLFVPSIAAESRCPVAVEYMPGSTPIVRSSNDNSLAGINGFAADMPRAPRRRSNIPWGYSTVAPGLLRA